MKTASILASTLALAMAACGDGSGSGAAITPKPAAKTRVEKVTMGGVKWEVTLPEDMKAPAYKVNHPEFLGDDDMSLTLDGTSPRFATVEEYIQSNVATKVLEKKQSGEAHFIVTEPQAHSAGKFLMTAVVPGQTIGWRCSGLRTREAEIRAMCASVKFARE